MTVANGQLANETTFNDAFPSRTQTTSSAGLYTFTNVTESNDPATGAVKLSGGLGVAKNLNVGGVLKATQFSGTIKTYSTQDILDGATVNYEVSQSVQYRRVVGDGGPIELALLPFGVDTSDLVDGALIILMGTHDTNTVKVINNDVDYGCLVFGDCTLYRGYMIALLWDAVLKRFIEYGRNS